MIGLLWLAAILFMAQTAQNSEQFSRLHPWILMINVAGLIVLVGLLVFDSVAPNKSVCDTVTLIAAPTSTWPRV